MGLRTALGLKRRREHVAVTFESWFAEKDFTSNWASRNFQLWADLLYDLRSEPVEVLEIGSWEGRSAIFFLEYFPLSRITCIDTFAGSPSLRTGWAQSLIGLEARFDANLAPYGSRVEKIRARSNVALATMTEQRRRFDLAYIDGSHARDDVLSDSALTWPLIQSGGIVIWDDAAHKGPKSALNDFLPQVKFDLLHSGYQVIVRKKGSRRDSVHYLMALIRLVSHRRAGRGEFR